MHHPYEHCFQCIVLRLPFDKDNLQTDGKTVFVFDQNNEHCHVRIKFGCMSKCRLLVSYGAEEYVIILPVNVSCLTILL